MADLSFIASTDGTDSSITVATISATLPTGTTTGDGQVIWYGSAVINPGGAPTHTTPAGWRLAGNISVTNLGGLDATFSCFVKVAGGSEGAETLTSNKNTTHQYIRETYRNLPSVVDFINQFAAFKSVASGTAHDSQGLTTTRDRCSLVGAVFATAGSITWTPPGTMTERVDVNSTTASDEVLATAGFSGSRIWTASATTGSVIGVIAFNSSILTISAQPTSQSVAEGATATFSVTAADGTPTYTYQWQDNSTGSFANISGATSSSYVTPVVTRAMDLRRYRCVVTDTASGTATSNEAQILLSARPPFVSPSPSVPQPPFNRKATSLYALDPANWGGASSLDVAKWFAPELKTAAAGGGITGTASITLAALTLASAGALPIIGAVAKTLDALTLASAGVLPIVGTASPTLGSLTLASTGQLAIKGVASVTLADATAVATGTLALQAALAKTLDDVTLAATGTLGSASGINGDLAKTLDDVTLSASGQLPIVGTVAQTLGSLTIAATGQLAIQGAATPTLDALTVVSTGQLAIQGTASVTLADATLAATGTLPLRGQVAVTLQDVGLSGSGTLPISGTLAATLQALTLAATGLDPNAGGGSPPVQRTHSPMVGVGRLLS